MSGAFNAGMVDHCTTCSLRTRALPRRLADPPIGLPDGQRQAGGCPTRERNAQSAAVGASTKRTPGRPRKCSSWVHTAEYGLKIEALLKILRDLQALQEQVRPAFGRPLDRHRQTFSGQQ
jgi:hypothetical protein